MNITNTAALVVVALVLYVGAIYCVRFLRGEIAPRLATWLIFEIGVAMSLASYLSGEDRSLVKAALNVADCFQVTIILLVLFFGRGRRRIVLTSYERLSLCIAAFAGAAWVLTKSYWIAFIGFQIVMTVAYLPTIESLWRWKSEAPPEPLDKWILNVVITLIAVLVDLSGKRDFLAMIYPLRALMLCGVVVALILRWRRKNMVLRT